jgi:hypothetical protein
MSKLKNAGAMLITAIPIVVWLWGVVSYGVAGDTLGSIAAFVLAKTWSDGQCWLCEPW